MVLVLYLFQGPLLRPKGKSLNVFFSEAIIDAQTAVLQCHVLVMCFFFTAQIMMPPGVLLLYVESAVKSMANFARK